MATIPGALRDAVQRDNPDALRRLLLASGAQRHPPESLTAALALAARQRCSAATAAALIDAGASPDLADALIAICDEADDVDVSGSGADGGDGGAELMRLLLARGANPDQVSRSDGKPALLLAVHHGREALVRLLLVRGANPNLAEPDLGWTPLVAAASADRLSLARLLLDADADPNAMSVDGTALAVAACRGRDRIVGLLLERRADPNLCADADDADGFGPLAYAAQNGHRGCVELLLRAGARPDLANALGHTPLILAALGCHAGVAAALLSAGADPNLAEPRHNWTPLITAVHVGGRRVADVLLEDRRTDVNRLSDDGTALAKAAEAGEVGMAACLLDARADANLTDAGGHSPLMWAAQSGHADVVARLLVAGARPESENSDGQSAILLAACGGREAALAELLRCRTGDPAGRLRAVRTAQAALAGAAGRGLERGLARRVADMLEGAQEQVVPNESYNLQPRDLQAGTMFSTKPGESAHDSSGQPQGVMVRYISNQTVLPHGYLQTMDIRRDSLVFLNRGHFGFVYRAQRSTGEYLVLKVVTAPYRPNRPDATAVSEANKREVDVMKAMQHRNFVQFYSAQLVENSFIICMEYVEGDNLRIHREQRGGFSRAEIVRYLRQICEALGHLHQLDIAHRDVKCENIMLQRATDLIKIVDFGLSKRIHTADIYHTGVVGTLLWMAPEVLLHEDMNRRRRRYDPKAADVYSLGCTLHEMCIGRPPLCSEGGVNIVNVCLYHAQHGNEPMPTDEMRRCAGSRLCGFYADCVVKNPDLRPSMAQLLAHPVFQAA